MKRPVGNKSGVAKLALALSWDGVRCPVRSLPPQARAFLASRKTASPAPAAARMTQLLADDCIRELRICWVPRLKGGDHTLSFPFATPNGLRLAFRPALMRQFGDVFVVVYQR